MKIIKVLLFIFSLFCFTLTKAQQVPFHEGAGCLFNGKIYWDQIGNLNGNPLYNGYQSPCTGTYSDDPNNATWITDPGSNGNCTVWVDCTGTRNRLQISSY